MYELDEKLEKGEELLGRAKVHPAVFAGSILCSSLCFGFLCLAFAQSGDTQLVLLIVSGVALLSSAFIFFASTLPRIASDFVVSDRRLLLTQGIRSDETLEIGLQELESIEFEATALGRSLGYGTLVIHAAQRETRLAFVANGSEIQARAKAAAAALKLQSPQEELKIAA